MLGVSRQRVLQLVAAPGFPEPRKIKAGLVWALKDIETWADRAGRLLTPVDMSTREPT